MVQPYLQSLPVDCWRHRGRLGVAEVNLCLFHDRCDAGIEPLLRVADELEREGPGARRTVGVRPCGRPHPVTQLKLSLHAVSPELRVMCVDCDAGIGRIDLTPIGLAAWRDAIGAWSQGMEDYGLAPRHGESDRRRLGDKDRTSAEIWFWGPGYHGP